MVLVLSLYTFALTVPALTVPAVVTDPVDECIIEDLLRKWSTTILCCLLIHCFDAIIPDTYSIITKISPNHLALTLRSYVVVVVV